MRNNIFKGVILNVLKKTYNVNTNIFNNRKSYYY